jgi:hypothetical protein
MKWCDRTLVKSPYYYGLCLSEKDFRATLKANGLTEMEYGESGLLDKGGATVSFYKPSGGQRLAIVCLGKGHEMLSLAQVYGLLIHEGVHIWQAIREQQREAEPSSEYEAYSVQSIATRLMEQYDSWIISGKKKKSKKKGKKK